MMQASTFRYCAVLAILVSAVRVFGQAVSGSIVGSVTDSSHASLIGADIDVLNSATGVHYLAKSNNSGFFTISSLVAGTYTVKVTAGGFKTVSHENIPVSVGSRVQADFVLPVGDVAQSVVVTGDTPLLESQQVEVATTLTAETMSELPSKGLNPQALAAVVPGVIMNRGQQGIPSSSGSANYSFVVNGQNQYLNHVYLDGVNDTEGISGVSAIVPNTDELQEFRIVTSNYDVEFGNAAGAVEVMTTKSGTNQLHGSVHEFNRVNALYAANPFTGAAGHLVYNQYGATLGGPVIKKHLFLFGYYDGTRYRSAAPIVTTVPTAAFRAGDFSSVNKADPIFDPLTGNPDGTGRTQFSNNIIPKARLNPIVQKLMAVLPLPNYGTGTDNNFRAPAITPVNADIGTIRADWTINGSSHLFGRFTHQTLSQSSTVPSFGVLLNPNYSTAQVGSNNNLVVDYTRVLNGSTTLETRFGWTSNNNSHTPVDFGMNTSADFGIPGLNNVCGACGGIAGFIIGGPVSSFTMGNDVHGYYIYNYGSYNPIAIVNWTHGSHSFKFGTDTLWTQADYRDTSSQGNFGCSDTSICPGNGFAQTVTGTPSVAISGLSVATFLLGDATAFGRVVYSVDLPHSVNLNQAFWAQDTWRATSNLTVTLGMRWDFLGLVTSPRRGGIANFNFANAETIISNFGDSLHGKSTSTANVNNNYNNWGPRIGLAYQLGKHTVLRAGYARAYNAGFFGANFGAVTNDWPNASRQDQIQSNLYQPIFTLGQAPPPPVLGFELLAAAGNPAQYPTPDGSAGFGFDPHNPTSSIDMWNVAYQRELTNNVTVTATYIGNTGRHNFYGINVNVPGIGQGYDKSAYPYARYGYYTAANNRTNRTSNGYQAVQLSALTRKFHGLTLTGAFTASSSFDYGLQGPETNIFNLASDRGPESTNSHYVFSLSHIYELPFGPGREFLSRPGVAGFLLGGWNVAGLWTHYSGHPFSPLLANTASLNSPCCGLRPDVVGNPAASTPSRSKWFNPAAYAVPGPAQFGNAPRNSLWGPSFTNVDLTLAKQFPLVSDRIKLEFAASAFNALNHPQLGQPGHNVDPGNSTAGVITSIAGSMRQLQLGATLRF